MNYNRLFKIAPKLAFLPLALTLVQSAGAQDTTRRQTIEITSEYKPDLRKTVKVDLYATPITGDTGAIRMAYHIPAQNLFFAYEPSALRPLTLQTDSVVNLGNRNRIKAGFGNFKTPYANAYLGFGDGKTGMLNLYGDYISSRGKIEHQDFSEFSIKGTGSLFTAGHEVYGGVGFAQHEYYTYGYDHEVYSYEKEDLRRSYQDFSVRIGAKNVETNSVGINYDPHIEIHAFTRENKADENSLEFFLPADKQFGENVSARLEVNGVLSSYQIKNNDLKVNNNVIGIAPQVAFANEILKLNAGATPTWNNGEFHMLPNLYAQFRIAENTFLFQGGWIGRFITNNFRTLSERNPYIQDPIFMDFTKEVQYYGGIKANISSHFNLNAKVAYLNYKNLPLFQNDDFDGKTFLITNEKNVNNFQIHGDINYINQDKFTLTAGVDLNSYTGLKENSHAWGLFPLEVKSSLRWYAFEQLLLKADLAAFSGAKAQRPGGDVKTLKGGTDLSLGAEFKLTEQFSVWGDFNNVLNSKYERWNQYPVYGFQVLGGLIFRF